MTRHQCIIVLCALVALVIGWIALSDPRGKPEHNAPVDGPQIRSDVVSPPPAEEPVTPPVERAADLSRTLQSDLEPVADTQPPLEILVVDATTGTPIADADIVFDTGSAQARVEAMPVEERGAMRYDSELVARTFGGATRTDAFGVARVGRGLLGTTIHARSGDRYGRR